MEPINLSETQGGPLNFRSTASNTSPAPWGCCSLGDYPQAHCFRQTGPPNCKHFQDNAEEKFPVQQFFPSVSWLPPFFCNGAISPNLCCSHNPMNPMTGSERQKHQEQDKMSRPANPCSFAQKEKCGFRVNNTKLEEDSQRNNCTFEPEPPLLRQPSYFLPDCQMNSFYLQCCCGDSFPWTRSPFIVPIISYCVFWKSQKSNIISGNYSGNSPNAFCQKESSQKHSDAGDEVFPRNLVKDFNNNIEEGSERKNCPGVDAVATKHEWENEEQSEEEVSDRKSTTSFDTINYTTGDGFENGEQMDNDTGDVMSGLHDICMEEDEEVEDLEDVEMLDSEDQYLKNEECLKADVPNSSKSLSNEPQDNESQVVSATESLLDLKNSEKNCASTTDLSVSDIEVNPSDSSTEEKHSENESQDQTKAASLENPISFKKSIKNFTMRDETNCVREEVQIPSPAAGDLGGVNCVGYKVHILGSFEGEQQYKILQETQTDGNLQSKKFLKDPSHPEDIGLESHSPRNPEKNSKTGKNFKSGIAKPLISSKLKAKTDATRNVKNNKKEKSRVEVVAVKRKHSCFPSDSAVGANQNDSKFKKTSNCRMVQHQIQGPEKQQQRKAKEAKGEPLKKEEKRSKVKPESACNLQKVVRGTGEK